MASPACRRVPSGSQGTFNCYDVGVHPPTPANNSDDRVASNGGFIIACRLLKAKQ